tara:strand:+ start:28551 stop:30314 length:1764 start_codon:yes stop_codon:yes gene_type:complete
MILFQTLSGFQLDLTEYGFTFNEESDYFSEETSKSYTLPVNINIDDELATVLGLVDIENISGYTTKVEGCLTIDEVFYDAYISINVVQGTKAELKLFYGKETLSVFDKNLSELPWPVIDTGGSLVTYAKSILDKSYPEVDHNFPMVYRPSIKENANYDEFMLFVNYYGNSQFFTNNLSGEEVFNRNVMAPMAYIKSVLKLGFETEGLQLRGEFANDSFFDKVVLVPDNYFEEYSNLAKRQSWQFEYYDSQETVEGTTISIYERSFMPDETGTYSIKYKLNFPAGIASNFDFKITYGETNLFKASTNNKPLIIDDVLEINLDGTSPYEEIKVVLRISEQQNTIAALNYFVFDLKGGDVNEFPSEYSLSDFMPDMTFREYFTRIKNWLNLEATYLENAVVLNYMDNTLQKLVYDDHSHLEIPLPKRTLNKNNLFKISYDYGNTVMFDKDGKTYSDADYLDSEITSIDLQVLPVSVSENNGLITGAFPEENSGLVLGIYDGLVSDKPVLRDQISYQDLSLQVVTSLFHKLSLKFRANSEQFNETYYARVHERFDLKHGIFKYNKKQLITSIKKNRISDKWWKITQVSESF